MDYNLYIVNYLNCTSERYEEKGHHSFAYHSRISFSAANHTSHIPCNGHCLKIHSPHPEALLASCYPPPAVSSLQKHWEVCGSSYCKTNGATVSVAGLMIKPLMAKLTIWHVLLRRVLGSTPPLSWVLHLLSGILKCLKPWKHSHFCSIKRCNHLFWKLGRKCKTKMN